MPYVELLYLTSGVVVPYMALLGDLATHCWLIGGLWLNIWKYSQLRRCGFALPR